MSNTRAYRGNQKESSYDFVIPENYLSQNLPFEPHERVNYEPYIASPDLSKVVNTALQLRRPLLLEGEPGCGKTRLAYSIAYELGYPIKECYIQSTSKAKDLLYSFDALRRLYDIQERRIDNQTELKPRKEYVTFGKLGEAILLARSGIPSVVLIDEIDKADIDFPNDLLLVLDRLWFKVDEVENDYRIDALQEKKREDCLSDLPIIIITSNREKELPKPFLRRCLFYYIDFPSEEQLANILKSRFGVENLPTLFAGAIQRFWKLRTEIQWRDYPGTSEFIDWVNQLRTLDNALRPEELISLPAGKLPFLETLVKTSADLQSVRKLQ